MLYEMGFCKGIENYSRLFSGRDSGQPPPTLLDYIPHDSLIFIDESHVTIPQIGSMYKGDRARKQNLVDYATVAYIPAENVIGLSKLNRIVEWFSRRPQMQESLTQQIHDYIADKMQCSSVAVSIACKHTCCSSRGIKHGSTMTTNIFSGVFLEKDNLVREELMSAIHMNGTPMK